MLYTIDMMHYLWWKWILFLSVLDLLVWKHFLNAKYGVSIRSMWLFTKRQSFQEAFFLDSKLETKKDKNANLIKSENFITKNQESILTACSTFNA